MGLHMLLYFSYFGLSRWQHYSFLKYYNILVNFDNPDGSTYWGIKYYNILVNFDHPDGSTSWGYICYYILVKFDFPDGSTIHFLNIIIF